MKNRLSHIKNLLLPCLVFSVITGVCSALLITAFKLAVETVIALSTAVYGAVRVKPIFIPVLALSTALIGIGARFLLTLSHSCRGGGIPTSITAIRGIVNFKWIKSIIILPISALLTFLCGIPLGTEGPCVQMGTAIGDGVVNCLAAKSQKGWRRYIMTGGAAAGFSVATSAPISAIIFSMEELHKHFSPMLLTVASISVASGQATAQLLSHIGIGSDVLFNIHKLASLDSRLLFIPIIVGIISGVCAIFFTRLYNIIDDFMHSILKKHSRKLVFPILFACICVIGVFFADVLGTGHGLTEQLFEAKNVWYVLILVFLVRMLLMMLSNTAGVTGGIFLPTVAFGAIIGALCAEAMTAFGIIGSEHYVFAIEALGGINNVLPIIIATTSALLVAEISGLEDFTDTLIESKIRSINKGQTPVVIEIPLTVSKDSFVEGKELRDILWPNACVIVSFDRSPENKGKLGIAKGDVITVHYKTYHPEITAEELKILVGEQSNEIEALMKKTS